MNEEDIDLYFSSLDFLLNGKRATLEIRWLELFRKTEQYNPKNIGILLALVHPNNYEGKLKKAQIDKELRTFFVNDRFDTSTLQRTSKCEIGVILGMDLECPHLKPIQQDHHWPFSLGGPTLRENRIHLCQECNTAKSNSPFFFKKEDIPKWLVSKLKLIEKMFH